MGGRPRRHIPGLRRDLPSDRARRRGVHHEGRNDPLSGALLEAEPVGRSPPCGGGEGVGGRPERALGQLPRRRPLEGRATQDGPLDDGEGRGERNQGGGEVIRYRAWDMVHRRWGKPGLKCDNPARCCMARPVLHWNFETGILELYPNDWAWLPSTGFIDRDKVEIFRGDIVSFAGRTATVSWNPDEGDRKSVV